MLDVDKISKIVKTTAQESLMPLFENVIASVKDDGSLVTEADLAVQQSLLLKLKDNWPEYGFFSEELTSSEQVEFFTQQHQGFWCLDPLDGTTNFSCGLPYFAISLALIVNNESVFGLVYDPVREECFTALKGQQGAMLNNKPIVPKPAPAQLSQCIANVDFKRLPEPLAVLLVTKPPFCSQRSFGAAALDWCWLAMGRCQLFLHGKQMLWDYAAGYLIAHESACVSSDLQGEPVFELSLDKRQVVAAVNRELFSQWFEFIKQAEGS
jgi:myo-inositol-1(or 4)-monophosphatase